MNDWCGQTTYVWRCMSIRYVASAIRRSTVPEAAYSQVNVSGCRRSRRPSSVFCGCLTITVAFASILLNIAMSGTALMVIIDATSPGSDVICTLLRSLWCQADSNCTVPTDHPADHPAHSSALHQTVRLMCDSPRTSNQYCSICEYVLCQIISKSQKILTMLIMPRDKRASTDKCL